MEEESVTNRVFPQHLIDRFVEEGFRRRIEEENEEFARELESEDEDKWDISENRFLENLMAERTAEIIDVIEKFLKEKGMKIPYEAKKDIIGSTMFSENDYYSIQEEIKEIMETLLHQSRGEFEDEGVE
jgi:succinate dehydrogenase flavin-adding protein (antitoxin of CptAB toxin-antitoxin module)